MHRLRSKLTYANVISTLCLCLLIGGGTAYAASQIEKESVGANQLKKGAVTPVKLSKASKATLTGPAGPAGPKGATGAQGPKGDLGLKGDPGTAGMNSLTNQIVIQTAGTGTVSASCNAGEHLTGGGASDESGGALKASYPNTGIPATVPSGTWTAIPVTASDTVKVRILCATP